MPRLNETLEKSIKERAIDHVMGARQSSDTLLRQWTMLRRIPREPRRISTAELKSALAAEGLEVTARTIQRDLEKLSAVFPLRSEQESRSNYWFWSERGNGIEVPGMSPATALTFLLARDYLTALFPPTTLGLLQPYFERAQTVLKSTQFHDWDKRVRAISRGPTLLPAKIDANVQSAVYAALLEQRRFAVDYKGREDKRKKRMEVNPLGLVVRAGVSYLVCTLWGYDDVRQLALHRMSKAELLHAPAKAPPGFDLAQYIEQEGGFSYPLSSKPIKLCVLFDKGAAAHLYETPLTPKQRLTERKDGRVLLEAEVLDTSELRWWLLGFGEDLEVIGPRHLRDMIHDIAAQMFSTYADFQN